MEGRIECVECICASTKPPCAGTQSNKPSGNGEVATVAGEGCRWKLLVTTLHAGGPGVTVAWSSTVESRCHSYPARASEQPCLGVALLSPNGEGNKKRFLKKADPNPTCPQTAAGWSSNTAVETISKTYYSLTTVHFLHIRSMIYKRLPMLSPDPPAVSD